MKGRKRKQVKREPEDWNILRIAVGETADEVHGELPIQLRLARYEVETRCPFVTVERRRGIKRARYNVRIPRYPGYLFARASALSRARMDADSVKGCIGWLVWQGRLVAVSDALVRSLTIDEQAKQERIETLFNPGDVVTITDDVWQGVEMVVVEDAGEALRVESVAGKITVPKWKADKVA